MKKITPKQGAIILTISLLIPAITTIIVDKTIPTPTQKDKIIQQQRTRELKQLQREVELKHRLNQLKHNYRSPY